MAHGLVKFPPIPVYSVKDGVYSPISLANFGFADYTRSDTVRRKRPKGVRLLLDGTAATTIAQSRHDKAFSYTSGKTAVYSSVCMHTPPGMGGETLPSDVTLVENRLRAQARSTSVNLGNALGEYKATAETFRSCFRQFVGAVGALYSRNPKKIRSYFAGRSVSGFGRKLTGQILQFQYGIKPLIGDVNDAIEVLREKAQARPLYIRVNAAKTSRGHWEYPGYDVAAQRRVPGQTITDITQRTSAWGLFELKNEVLNTTLGRFGLTNPVAVAYELVPGSFILDWWFNVGEVLASLDNCLYLGEARAQITVKSQYKRSSSQGGATAIYTKTQNNRGAVKGLGHTASLRYKPSVSATHIVNGLALFAGQLSNLGVTNKYNRFR